jgi:hypothetical protein
MTAPTTPYTKYLGERDPLAAMRDTLDRVAAVLDGWPANRFERSYAPGKWNARQILTHLAQVEMALGTRARMAVATPDYAAQSWDQDAWMVIEPRLTAGDARDAFLAIARMNLSFFEGLSADQRAIGLSHPEYGSLTVDWIVHQMAGHQINHLRQLEQIR